MTKLEADHPVWGPRLQAIAAELEPYDTPFIETLQQPWKDRVVWVRSATTDLLYVMKLYLLGFELVKSGRAETSSGTLGWVNRVDGSRSVRLQACTIAAGFCGILESTLPDMAEQFAVPAELARINRRREISRDVKVAKAQLNRWANPSSKGDVKWAPRVADLFDLTISDDAKEALTSMIAARHNYTHQRLSVLSGETPADELSSWFMATMLISTLAGEAVSVRIKTLKTPP